MRWGSYVADTSGLIGAWQRRYPPDVFPPLWDNLDALGRAGGLLVPEEVYRELQKQSDELYEWVDERREHLVVPTDRAAFITAQAVLADHPLLTKTGTGRGLADPFVIALAELRGLPVLTEEAGGSSSKPRIPYVCGQRGLGIDCIDMLGLIRGEGWSFR